MQGVPDNTTPPRGGPSYPLETGHAGFKSTKYETLLEVIRYKFRKVTLSSLKLHHKIER